MPQDLNGAAALLSSDNDSAAPETVDTTETTTDSDASETPAPKASAESVATGGDSDKQPPATEPEPPKPSAAELRLAEMQERLAALKEKRKARADDRTVKENLARQRQLAEQLAAREASTKAALDEAEAQRKLWKESLKNPIAAYKQLGIKPGEAYDAISSAAEKANTPESKLEAMREELEAKLAEQYSSKFSEFDALKKELERLKQAESDRLAERADAARRTSESEFLKIVGQSGYEVLADYYDPEELVFLGHSLANEFTESGQRFRIEDIATELKSRLETQLKRAEQRRSQRTASTQPPASTASDASAAPKANPAASKTSADTVGNAMASSVATSVPKRLTPEQRRAEAARELALLEAQNRRQ